MSGLLDDLNIGENQKNETVKPRGNEYNVALECQERKRIVTAGTKSQFQIKITNTGTKSETFTLKTEIVHAKSEDSPEWTATVSIPGVSRKGKKNDGKKEPDDENTATLEPGESVDVQLGIEVPRGAKYGDRADVIFSVISKSDPAVSESINVTSTAKQAILAIKTAIGHERNVADSLASKAREKDIGIFSVLAPGPIRGYVFVESMNIDALRDTIRNVRRAHAIVEGETSFKDIEHFLTPKPVVSGISEGSIVELIAGPFKGERAMVKKIDESKEEITVELIEAMVAIPITVRGDHVRVIQKE